ncbi:hypothetical protein [Williamsia sp. CHRR-6]|uniref:hypothetical protein n=1 Tax=Williamsia sp. CHRR-6 TaxID=2835871 RepID=UPI001BD91632|nr:hypothetical protein [Williamsia sp. CHRR-6]MBT0566064.1 hypothetical protein [Williamsia sp. CHRR-6]
MTAPDDSPIYPRRKWLSAKFRMQEQVAGFAVGLLLLGITVITYGAGLLLCLIPAAGLASDRWRGHSFAAIAPLLAFATVGPGYLLVQFLAGR